MQLAKVTPDYNTEVAEERVIKYANKIVELTNIQRNAHSVRKCHVLAAGDIVAVSYTHLTLPTIYSV